MDDVARFREQAADAQAQAEKAISPLDKEAWLKVAGEGIKLAAIWFGGTGSLWFRMRIGEIRALANARIRLGIGEVAYLNLITLAIGLFIVGGYFVIVDWQHGEMDNFLAFLLYCGLMTGPVIRVSSFIPECREYLQAKRNLEETIASCPKPEYRLQSTEQLSFSANDNRPDQNRKIDISSSPNPIPAPLTKGNPQRRQRRPMKPTHPPSWSASAWRSCATGRPDRRRGAARRCAPGCLHRGGRSHGCP
jgi:ABC-type multidrug transport system fused ATPase/permease subunit